MSRSWSCERTLYRAPWGGREWTLDPAADRPGLRADGCGPLLSLEGVAVPDRWDPGALGGAALSGHECRHGCVEATYAPRDWEDLVVRATWSILGDDGIELVLQAVARSVDRLKALELRVASVQPVPEGEAVDRPLRWVEPRDARSAGFSYDGRETDLTRLTTLPPREEAFSVPRLIDLGDGLLYAEMVHPDDVTRRIREGGRTLAQAKSTRYGLLGHDLERGVVLRARMRAFLLRGDDASQRAHELLTEFIAEEPPLGT